MTGEIGFIHDLAFADLPAEVVQQAKRCTLDLIGVAAGGRETALADIACRFAARYLSSSEAGARILFDGRRASPMGAAYAGAATIDALDAHDGHALTKGHAGAALLPALLAVVDAERTHGVIDGRSFLTCLTMGYEIAIRAGMALHASVPDYHTSGAWNALGCAAIAARLLRLNRDRTRDALGIAEYHGPRSQMMRCIDHPTMVKDGSGWGAFTGVTAAYLAADGFTGAPAVTLENPEQSPLWSELGHRWRILELYFKPEPICRWAQPATEAARQLRAEYGIKPGQIREIRIETFDAAVRLGARMPATTEEAQYAIAFPVAVMLDRGHVGPSDVAEAGLRDPNVQKLCAKTALAQRDDLTARFPRERIAIVSITLQDGRTLTSPQTAARGEPEHSLTSAEILQKFHDMAACLSPARRDSIAYTLRRLSDNQASCEQLLNSVLHRTG